MAFVNRPGRVINRINPKDGKPMWSAECGFWATRIVPSDGRIHVIGRGNIETFDSNASRSMWKISVNIGTVVPKVAVNGGRLLVTAQRARKESLQVIDATTGKTTWSTPEERGCHWSVRSNALYVSDRELVRKYTLATGIEVWNAKGNWPEAMPNGIVAVETQDGMTGLDGETGRIVWNVSEGKRIRGRQGSLLFASKGTRLVAIESVEGRILWTSDLVSEVRSTHAYSGFVLVHSYDEVDGDIAPTQVNSKLTWIRTVSLDGK